MRLAAALCLALQIAAVAPPPAGSATGPAASPAADGAPPLRGAAPEGSAPARADGRARASGSPSRVAPTEAAPPGAALTRLRGGGDEAPLCRSSCAGRFYRCASGGDAGDCAADLRTCRAQCDTASQPAGRLVFAPPLVGLPAAAALQGFGPPPAATAPPR